MDVLSDRERSSFFVANHSPMFLDEVVRLEPCEFMYSVVTYSPSKRRQRRKVELVTWVLDLWPESLRAAGGSCTARP